VKFSISSAPDPLVAAAVAGGLFLLIWILRALIVRRFRDAAQTESPVDDFFLLVAQKTKLFLFVAPCLYVGAQTQGWFAGLDLRAPLHVATLLSFIAQTTLWVTAVVDFSLRRYKRVRFETDPGARLTINAFRVGALIALWTFATVLAIHNLGFDVTALIAGLGIGGVAVALATQNILADLFASLSIVIDKPFIPGDAISVDKNGGTVEHIGLKTTRLRAASGEQLIFSNGDLLKSRIQNFARMQQRRVQLRFAIRFDTPVATLERIPTLLQSAVAKHPGARFERAHLVAFGDSGYELEVSFHTPPEQDAQLDLQQAVMLDVVRTLESERVSLAEREHTRAHD